MDEDLKLDLVRMNLEDLENVAMNRDITNWSDEEKKSLFDLLEKSSDGWVRNNLKATLYNDDETIQWGLLPAAIKKAGEISAERDNPKSKQLKVVGLLFGGINTMKQLLEDIALSICTFAPDAMLAINDKKFAVSNFSNVNFYTKKAILEKFDFGKEDEEFLIRLANRDKALAPLAVRKLEGNKDASERLLITFGEDLHSATRGAVKDLAKKMKDGDLADFARGGNKIAIEVLTELAYLKKGIVLEANIDEYYKPMENFSAICKMNYSDGKNGYVFIDEDKLGKIDVKIDFDLETAKAYCGHKEKAVREIAFKEVSEMTGENEYQEFLKEFATNTKVKAAKLYALNQIKDQSFLRGRVEQSTDLEERIKALGMLHVEGKSESAVKNQEFVKSIVLDIKENAALREFGVGKLSDKDMLIDLACNGETYLAQRAYARICKLGEGWNGEIYQKISAEANNINIKLDAMDKFDKWKAARMDYDKELKFFPNKIK